MKNFTQLALISTLTTAAIFCTSSVYATVSANDSIGNSNSNSNSININANALSTVEVRSNYQPYRKANNAFQEVRGKYWLDDGSYLTLYKVGRRFFAEITDQPSFEIILTGAATFASGDGATELIFKQYDNGVVGDVLVRMPRKNLQLVQR